MKDKEELRDYVAKKICESQYKNHSNAWERIAFHKREEYMRMADDMIVLFWDLWQQCRDKEDVDENA